MLVPNQYIEVKWHHSNKNHYINKGYKYTYNGDAFFVKAEDLYSGSHQKVRVICDYCGKEYEVEFRNYIKVINNGEQNACDQCKSIKSWDKSLLERQEKLYNIVQQICEEEGYILLTEKQEIKNNDSYIEYICPFHGLHQMKISNFRSGKRCPECGRNKLRTIFQLSNEEVKNRINNCGGVWINELEYKNMYEKNLIILCPECGKPFKTSLSLFTEHGGQLCDDCSNQRSVGETKIKKYLENNKIIFIPQKTFEDCKDIRPLPFDFYLPDYNIIIEFDGRQHFGETNYFKYSYEKTHCHDEIKNNYCYTHGIYLIRIPYWKIDKIEQILDSELILHEDIV